MGRSEEAAKSIWEWGGGRGKQHEGGAKRRGLKRDAQRAWEDTRHHRVRYTHGRSPGGSEKQVTKHSNSTDLGLGKLQKATHNIL